MRRSNETGGIAVLIGAAAAAGMIAAMIVFGI